MTFGIFCIAMLAAIPLAIWNGYALMVLWGWFVVPLFDLPPLTIAQAIGLSVLVGFLTHQRIESKEDEKPVEDTISAVLFASVKPAMALLIGWIVTLWM